jgi:hypothetical protein
MAESTSIIGTPKPTNWSVDLGTRILLAMRI